MAGAFLILDPGKEAGCNASIRNRASGWYFSGREPASDFSPGCALEVRCQLYNEYARELGHDWSRSLWQFVATADSCISLVATVVLGVQRSTCPLCTRGREIHLWWKYTKQKSIYMSWEEQMGQIWTYLNEYPIYRPPNRCKLEKPAQERTEWSGMRAQRGRTALGDVQWSPSVLQIRWLKEIRAQGLRVAFKEITE